MRLNDYITCPYQFFWATWKKKKQIPELKIQLQITYTISVQTYQHMVNKTGYSQRNVNLQSKETIIF